MDKPLLLQPNDKVALVSPASTLRDSSLLEKSIALLESWHLNVVDLTNQNQWHYLAAPDIERAESLNKAFADSDIKAIFCLRGGYGCARLYDYLDWQAIQLSSKILIGFSDITYLHLALTGTQHRCIHAANVGFTQFLESPADGISKQSLYQTLFTAHQTTQAINPIIAGNCVGKLTGGCLSIVVTTLGTPYEIDTEGKLLLLEDVNEAVYSVDRMLTHLKQAGKFNKINGIVFGDCYQEKDKDFFISMLENFFTNADFPVYHGLAFGHGHNNMAWVYNKQATVSRNTIHL